MSANKTGAGFMILAMGAFALEDSFFKAATQLTSVSSALISFGLMGLSSLPACRCAQAKPSGIPLASSAQCSSAPPLS